MVMSSPNGMLSGSENGGPITTHATGESQKHNVERKTPGTEEHCTFGKRLTRQGPLRLHLGEAQKQTTSVSDAGITSTRGSR